MRINHRTAQTRSASGRAAGGLHRGSEAVLACIKERKTWGGHMTTRRNFLKAGGSLAGLVFCGCGLPLSAHAQTAAAPARSPVTVKGKRIKTIDVHAHCFFQQAIDAAGEKLEAVQPKVLGTEKLFV